MLSKEPASAQERILTLQRGRIDGVARIFPHTSPSAAWLLDRRDAHNISVTLLRSCTIKSKTAVRDKTPGLSDEAPSNLALVEEGLIVHLGRAVDDTREQNNEQHVESVLLLLGRAPIAYLVGRATPLHGL